MNPEENQEKKEELSPEEEDKKELYDAIKDLKPEEANENIKAKLLSMAQVHLDYKKIETDQYGKEYDKLQDKYDKQYKEIYNKIDEIVVSTSEIKVSDEEKNLYGITDDDAGKEHKIEDYWNKVITNSRYFTINDKDKSIIKYILKVQLEKFENNINNFRVDFIFQDNEFFTPNTLSKTYEFDSEGVLKKAIGTTINWKSPEKNPTIEKVKKRRKKGKKTFNEEKEEKVDSFFSFFSQCEDMTFLQDEVTFFKDDLFVNQLEYFLDIVSKTKEAAGEDEDDIEDDDNGDGDGDGGQRHDGKGQKQEECKQQ